MIKKIIKILLKLTLEMLNQFQMYKFRQYQLEIHKASFDFLFLNFTMLIH